MKIALAQMSMTDKIEENLNKSLNFCDKAKDCDLLFFPEIQLSPFFPQYQNKNVEKYCLYESSSEIQKIKEKAKEHSIYISPNVYMSIENKKYDTSLWINRQGNIVDKAKMVHIAQAENFYEQDYYTPSDDGFKVFDTEYGKVGVVICYDRHLPESIRTCVLKGADLIIIPTANTKAEPMEMFEWEVRVQAMENQVFVAMCNRVGKEDNMDFSGQSLVVDPNGEVICKADDSEQLLACDIDLKQAKELRKKVPYIGTRQTGMVSLKGSDTMNKTIFTGILICIVSFILSGCNGNTYGITSGTYEMVDSEENVFTPYLTLDLEDKTFTFTFDVLSSYGNIGSIKFNKGNLICKTDDNKNTFIFKVENNNTLKFDATQSSSTTTVDDHIAVPDETEFKLANDTSES